MKAGLMEIADIFVVNKSDRPGADEMRRQLIEAASFLKKDGWQPPVIETVALDQRGINQLLDQLEAHNHWLRSCAEPNTPDSGPSQQCAGSSAAPTRLALSDSQENVIPSPAEAHATAGGATPSIPLDPVSVSGSRPRRGSRSQPPEEAWVGSAPGGEDGGRLERKRLQQHQARIRESVKAALEENLWGDNHINQQLNQSAQQLRTGQISFPTAVEQVWTQVLQHLSHQTTITRTEP